MPILASVIGLFALVSLGVAVREAVAIVQMSPRGRGLGNYFVLGWWKFAAIEAQVGPDAKQHLSIYKRAVIAFIVLVLIGLVLSGLATGYGRS